MNSSVHEFGSRRKKETFFLRLQKPIFLFFSLVCSCQQNICFYVLQAIPLVLARKLFYFLSSIPSPHYFLGQHVLDQITIFASTRRLMKTNRTVLIRKTSVEKIYLKFAEICELKVAKLFTIRQKSLAKIKKNSIIAKTFENLSKAVKFFTFMMMRETCENLEKFLNICKFPTETFGNF